VARTIKQAAALAAMLVAGLAWAQPRQLSPEDLYEKVAPSVWRVDTQSQGSTTHLGSAVVIAPGELVTSCHVVEKAKIIAVSHGGPRFSAQIHYRDPSRDLCQLTARGIKAPAVPFADEASLRVGAKVYAIGNPRGLELTLTDGLISGLRRDPDGKLEAVQMSVPVSPGSSGGGLFDAYGKLVGIVTFSVKDAQNLNFALPAAWVAELPKRAGGQSVARAPTDVAGRWAGQMRCGPLLLPGQRNVGGWSARVTMTVQSGNATMQRGGASYSETAVGKVQPDRSVRLQGTGTNARKGDAPWTTSVNGRFVQKGEQLRFEGEGGLSNASGPLRECTVSMTRAG
jgi:hypothetical protein